MKEICLYILVIMGACITIELHDIIVLLEKIFLQGG
jgi:hypothetical protein